ncbi:hypothetical protein [Burkholderia cenocepacia]|jgi:hypothetical protein|uniref:hypothetical protein n=1 Tax=Burkholderia cenocepacia TaxID=95486 RepID=UPI00114D3066|nr:hypothetical protein [Burkholderia cenocepacia]
MCVLPKFLRVTRRTGILAVNKIPRDKTSMPGDPPDEATIGTVGEKVARDYGICGAAHRYYDAQRQIIRQSDDQDAG